GVGRRLRTRLFSSPHLITTEGSVGPYRSEMSPTWGVVFELTQTRSQTLAPITLRPIPIHTTGAGLARNDFFRVLPENVPLRTLVLRDPPGPRITSGGEGDP